MYLSLVVERSKSVTFNEEQKPKVETASDLLQFKKGEVFSCEMGG